MPASLPSNVKPLFHIIFSDSNVYDKDRLIKSEQLVTDQTEETPLCEFRPI